MFKSMKSTLLFWIIAFIPFIFLLYMINKFGIDMPKYDQWEIVPVMNKLFSGQLKIADCCIEQGGHKFFFSTLIMLFLAKLSHWNIRLELFTNIVFALGMFILLAYQIKSTATKLNDNNMLWIIPVVSLMVFSLAHHENWYWGWQISLLLCTVCIVSGITLLSGANFGIFHYVMAILAGVIATFSFACGIIYWILGLTIILLTRRNYKNRMIVLLLPWIIVATINIFIFYHDQPQFHRDVSISYVLSHVLQFIYFILLYLGTPLITFDKNCAVITGIFGLLAFFFLIVLHIRRRYFSPRMLAPYIVFGFYPIISSLLTGYGRLYVDVYSGQSSRYIINSQFLWIAIIVLAYLFISYDNFGLLKQNRARKIATITASVIVGVLVIANSARGVSRTIRAYSDMLEMKRIYILSSEDAQPGIDILRKHHLTVFRSR